MKNINQKMLAVVLFGLIIILCVMSVLFLKDENSTLSVLSSNAEIEDKQNFLKKSYNDNLNFEFYNCFGGSEDEFLVGSFCSGGNYYIVVETLSNNFDLTSINQAGQKSILLLQFNQRLDLCNCQILFINAKIKKFMFTNQQMFFLVEHNETYYLECFNLLKKSIFKIEIDSSVCDFYINGNFVYFASLTTKQLKMKCFDVATQPILQFESEVINQNLLLHIEFVCLNSTPYLLASGKNYVLFLSVCQNQLNELIGFEIDEHFNINCFNDEILLLTYFKSYQKLVMTKINEDFKIEFCKTIQLTALDCCFAIKQANGYNITILNSNNLQNYFLCIHGDVIISFNVDLDISINKILPTQGGIEILGTTSANNICYLKLTHNLNTVSNTIFNSDCGLENYAIHNNIIIFETSSAVLDFTHNNGKKDIFIFALPST